MRRTFLLFVLLAASVHLAAGPVRGEDETAADAAGDERILSFGSEITVLPDGSLAVRETIRVRAAGLRINHGIYRDFTTRYRSSEGICFDVPFRLIEVLRDGKPEPWRTKERENGIRAFLGDAERRLAPGEYTYSIAYHTDRQLGFFRDHDELFWSVTGYDWTLPIDEVEARVLLPGGVTPASLEVLTGARESRERDATAAWHGAGGATFRATRPFQAGEGLTVIVRWAKGFVKEPAPPQRWWWLFLGSNPSAIAGLAGLLLVLTYYVVVGRKVARSPGRGVVVPRAEVPEGLSPAAVRFVCRGSCDIRTFAATLVQMAIKGAFVIEERGGRYVLRRVERDGKGLMPEEALLADDLCPRRIEQVGIERANQPAIGGAVNDLRNFLRVSLERFYLSYNGELLGPGVALSLVVLGATLPLERGLVSVTRVLIALLLFFWTIGVTLLSVQFVYRVRDVILRRGPRRDTLCDVASIAVFSIPLYVAEIGGLALVVWLGSYSYGLVLLGVGLLNARFHYHFKAPASAGRGLLDRIEGLRLWLAASGAEGTSRSGPELTPAVYEKFLPYAIALDCEERWSRRCAGVLAIPGREGGSYRPSWFDAEPAAGGWNPATFAVAVGGAFCAAIDAAAGSRGK